MTNQRTLSQRLRCVDPMDQWSSIEERCNLAADELDRLSRIEIKYVNLCGVLNEQAGEIERRDQQLKESVDHETEYMAEIERLREVVEEAIAYVDADSSDGAETIASWRAVECSGPLGHHVHRIGPGPCVYCGHTESSVLEPTEHHVTDSTDMPRPP